MAERKAKPEINFEKSLKQLEEIVHRLEDEELPLDQAVKLFAQGQSLARACEGQLRAAELKVRQLIETPQGEISEIPLELDGDPLPEDALDEEMRDKSGPETPRAPGPVPASAEETKRPARSEPAFRPVDEDIPF